MRKFIAFIIQWGCFAAGLYFLFQLVNIVLTQRADAESISGLLKNAILTGVFLLLSGIGKRIYHISKDEIENNGSVSCILSRIFCKRFLTALIMYFGMTAFVYAVHMFMSDRFEIIWGIIGFFCFFGGFFGLKYSCKRCGHGLVMHDTDYDDDITVDIGETSATAYRYSTDFYHCPRCGKQRTIRAKHTAGRVNYR